MSRISLPFLASQSAEVKCRHCGSTNVRVSTRSSGSEDHVTYRCHDCKRHFRTHTGGPSRQNLVAAGAFLALVLISVGTFIYLAGDHGHDSGSTIEYQPAVDMSNQASLAKTQQAARQGNAQAQYDLGWAHWQRSEYLAALPWIKAAAAQGHAEAEYLLGTAYLEGHGTVQNYHSALEYFSRAAQRAHLEAQYRLGLFYRDGLGTPPNKESAYVWLNVAAARGHDDALHYRDKLAAAMGSDEIHRAQEASAQTLAKFGNLAGKAP